MVVTSERWHMQVLEINLNPEYISYGKYDGADEYRININMRPAIAAKQAIRQNRIFTSCETCKGHDANPNSHFCHTS